MKTIIAFNICLVVIFAYLATLPSSADAQITFSRDWLAGSGKRAKPISFSREWLASGKRSADNDAWACIPKVLLASIMQYIEDHEPQESHRSLSEDH